MGSRPRRVVGARAENAAYRYLLDHGLRPVTRNFRCRGGEIDLIMLDRRCLVFIEVRYRRSSAFTPPAHTVDARKQRKIIRAAALYCARERRAANLRVRFDVIAIDAGSPDGICWIRDAFRPDDTGL